MPPLKLSPSLFVTNRERLRGLLAPNSLVVVNANDVLPANADGSASYHPNSDLFYLTGVEQEESVLLLAPDAFEDELREVLFLKETDEQIGRWEGQKLTKEEARKVTGIARVKWLSEFPLIFHTRMCEVENVYLNSNEHRRATITVESRDTRFIHETRSQYPLHRYQRLAPLLHQLRAVKSPMEVEATQRAANLTRDAYARVLRFVQPGVNEREIEAEFAHTFIRECARFAYPPIIASGKNACILHYATNDQRCAKGDLLLLDVGASCRNYNADVTRTIPVSGRFSKRQRRVYEAVLRTLRRAMDALRPGKFQREWQKEAEAFIEEELLELGLLKPQDIRRQDPDLPAVKQYFMHGIGHPLGLDVHDVATARAPFAAGWIMTVEPGIYIPEEELAVRLEDDVLIGESTNTILTADIPLEIEAIEAAMRR